MRILYAIQATGNGHISRARALIPYLRQLGHLDLLLSGTNAQVSLDETIKYRLKGVGFAFGKNGGIDYWQTFNEASLLRIKKEYSQLPVQDYDLVINDFEPISAWACKLKHVPCIALSHQSALLDKNTPMPEETDLPGALVLHYYAPAHLHIGFHFQSYSPAIFTPVIRDEVRQLNPSNKGHHTVYLPAYDDEKVARILEKTGCHQWEIFSKQGRSNHWNNNIRFIPVNARAFAQSMASSKGVLCGAGFETPSEALFLGKKVLVIPMKQQYEQQCNAAALEQLGASKISSLDYEAVDSIKAWASSHNSIQLDYPNRNQEVVETIADFYSRIADEVKQKKRDRLLAIRI